MDKILYSIDEGFFKSIEIDDTELDSYLVKKNIPDLFPIKSEDGSTFETEHKDTTHHKILKGSGDWYYYEAKEDHEYTNYEKLVLTKAKLSKATFSFRSSKFLVSVEINKGATHFYPEMSTGLRAKFLNSDIENFKAAAELARANIEAEIHFIENN